MSSVSRFFLPFVAALLVFTFACDKKDAHSEFRIVVAKYNNALAIAHKEVRAELLRKYATESHLNKVRALINAYASGGEAMVSDLKKISYGNITTDGDKAVVATSEEWTYKWIDYRSGVEIDPEKKAVYENKYHLVKKDGNWLVDTIDVKLVSEKVVKSK